MTFRIVFSLLAILMLGACATGPTDRYYGSGYGPGYGTSTRGCYDCGVVERIETVYGPGRTSGGGAVLGGVVGGVLGSQVGSGSGRTAATVAGAVAGGVAGDRIERSRESESFEITVAMDDGRRLIVYQRDLHGLRPGARVRLDRGVARLY
jgi:outer membrane lipoprotein SlyB